MLIYLKGDSNRFLLRFITMNNSKKENKTHRQKETNAS